MAAQWDPYAVLNINKSRSRCYGWAPSKGRLCENPISITSRNEAHRLISRIARLDPSDDEVMELLSHVARCLLCRNRHQGQATSVLDRWEQRIETVTESSTVEGDGEEEEEENEIVDETTRLDQRRQMTEIHEILRRIETALVANQRRVGMATSANNNQNDPVNRPEVPLRGSQTNEADSAGLSPNQSSIHHLQSPVRQLATENEPSQQRGNSLPMDEAGDATGITAGTVTSRNSSPQTLMGDEPNEQGSVQQATEEAFLAAVTLPDTDDFVRARDHGNESSATEIEDTLPSLEQERAEMRPRSFRAERDGSTPIASLPRKDDTLVERHKVFGQDIFQGFRLPNTTLQGRRNTNTLWLTTLIVYIGVVTIWHLLGLNQMYPRFLGLPDSVSHVGDTAAEPLRLDGPPLTSLEILKCY